MGSKNSLVDYGGIPAMLGDNPAWPLSKRIRHFYGDQAKGNIHDVLSRNGCPVMYFNVKQRANAGHSIEKALTDDIRVPSFSDKTLEIIEIINKHKHSDGQSITTTEISELLGISTHSASDSVTMISRRFTGLIRKRVGQKTEISSTDEGLIEIEDDDDDAKEKPTVKFVKRARHTPIISQKINNPNWFIVKRFG